MPCGAPCRTPFVPPSARSAFAPSRPDGFSAMSSMAPCRGSGKGHAAWASALMLRIDRYILRILQTVLVTWSQYGKQARRIRMRLMEFSLADPRATIRRVFDNTDAELHDPNEI